MLTSQPWKFWKATRCYPSHTIPEFPCIFQSCVVPRVCVSVLSYLVFKHVYLVQRRLTMCVLNWWSAVVFFTRPQESLQQHVAILGGYIPTNYCVLSLSNSTHKLEIRNLAKCVWELDMFAHTQHAALLHTCRTNGSVTKGKTVQGSHCISTGARWWVSGRRVPRCRSLN